MNPEDYTSPAPSGDSQKRRTVPAFLRVYLRLRKKERQDQHRRLQKHLGETWTSSRCGYRFGDARVVSWNWGPGYSLYLGGCCVRARKLKDFLGMLRRLGLPTALAPEAPVVCSEEVVSG